MGKSIIRAVLDGAREIAVPAFVSSLAISIVFVPVVLLQGTAKYLLQPLAMAVVFAMMASYVLSRTLIPTMVRYLLVPELQVYRSGVEIENARIVLEQARAALNATRREREFQEQALVSTRPRAGGLGRDRRPGGGT
jgi:multidrug efflux pump subunit AcrB